MKELFKSSNWLIFVLPLLLTLKNPILAGVDVGILEGGINNTTNEEVATQNARTHAKYWLHLVIVLYLVVCLPCVISLPWKNTLRRAYIETESTDAEWINSIMTLN